MRVDLNEHKPTRPTWSCRSCGEDWPCGPARGAGPPGNRDDIDRQLQLSMAMWAFLESHYADDSTSPKAFEHFIGWALLADIRMMGSAEIMRRLGVSRQRVYQITSLPTFPQPTASLEQGRIWAAIDVEAWIAKYRPSSSLPMDPTVAVSVHRHQTDARPARISSIT
jgi:prophage regulatory protein